MVVVWVVKGRRLNAGEVHASALKFKKRPDFRGTTSVVKSVPKSYVLA